MPARRRRRAQNPSQQAAANRCRRAGSQGLERTHGWRSACASLRPRKNVRRTSSPTTRPICASPIRWATCRRARACVRTKSCAPTACSASICSGLVHEDMVRAFAAYPTRWQHDAPGFEHRSPARAEPRRVLRAARSVAPRAQRRRRTTSPAISSLGRCRTAGRISASSPTSGPATARGRWCCTISARGRTSRTCCSCSRSPDTIATKDRDRRAASHKPVSGLGAPRATR